MKRIIITSLCAGFLLSLPAIAQHKHAPKDHGHHSHRFDDPEKWAKRFDNPERNAWQMPDKVVEALAIKPEARVADIGAGTGYFTIRLARVASKGTVYSVDIEPKMVAYLGKRAKSQGLENVRPVLGAKDSANLPSPVDLALLVNSYHHIEGRVAYIKKLAKSLRPNGRIALVEYRPDAKRGAPKHFRLSIAQMDKEMMAAGFKRVASHDFLPHQNFLIYQAARKTK